MPAGGHPLSSQANFLGAVFLRDTNHQQTPSQPPRSPLSCTRGEVASHMRRCPHEA